MQCYFNLPILKSKTLIYIFDVTFSVWVGGVGGGCVITNEVQSGGLV